MIESSVISSFNVSREVYYIICQFNHFALGYWESDSSLFFYV